MAFQDIKYAPRKCERCGKEYIPISNSQKYCGEECREQADKESRRRYETKRKKKPKKKKALDPLSEIAAKARQAGMSYGKYVGLQMREPIRSRT